MRTGNKVGGNKGIARARKQRKRVEAEERNARTPAERRSKRTYEPDPKVKKTKGKR